MHWVDVKMYMISKILVSPLSLSAPMNSTTGNAKTSFKIYLISYHIVFV